MDAAIYWIIIVFVSLQAIGNYLELRRCRKRNDKHLSTIVKMADHMKGNRVG